MVSDTGRGREKMVETGIKILSGLNRETRIIKQKIKKDVRSNANKETGMVETRREDVK
jgi:hypothetical protein